MISVTSVVVSSADRSRYLIGISSPCRRTRGGLPETRCRSEPPCLTTSSRNVSIRLGTGCALVLSADQVHLRQQLGIGDEALQQLLVLRVQVGGVGIDLLG